MDTTKITAALLGVIVVFIVGAVFKAAQIVLVPLIIAALLYFVFAPVVNFLEQVRVPRGLSIVIVVLILLGFFFFLGFLVNAGIHSFIRVYPHFQSRLIYLIRDTQNLLNTPLGDARGILPDINWTNALRTTLLSVSGSFLKFAGGVGIILVFLIFLLLERPYFQSKLTNAFDEATRQKVAEIFDHMNIQIGRFLAVKLFISIVTGMEVYLALLVLGVDFPILWGVVAMLVNFIPNLGAFFIVAVTTLMAFVQFYPAVDHPIVVFAVMSVIQLVMGNFVDPRLLGSRLNLSPFIILVSLIFWGWLWGIVGAFLSVPITVVIKIICDNVPFLRPIGIFMGSGKIHRSRDGVREETNTA